MKTLAFFLTLIFIYILYGLVISQFGFRVLNSEFRWQSSQHFYDYRGLLHIESNFSGGSGSYEEIIEAGQEARADFLVITDLNPLKRNFEYERYHNNLMVLLGGKYSYLDSRFLVIDSLHRFDSTNMGQIQSQLADRLSATDSVVDADRLFILAHPFKHPYQWTGALPEGVRGAEIINLKSIWQKAWLKSRLSFFWTLLIYPFNPDLALVRLFQHPVQENELWDQESRRRSFYGYAGTDASARIFAFRSLRFSFPSYVRQFRIASNHVLLNSELTGHFEGDRRKILDAFRRGQFYFSIDVLADPKGFVAFMSDSKDIYTMGSKVQLSSGLKLNVQLPDTPQVPFEIILMRDGERYRTSNGTQESFPIIEPGVYRIVVRTIPTLPLPDGKKWLDWIYSNPFFVRL